MDGSVLLSRSDITVCVESHHTHKTQSWPTDVCAGGLYRDQAKHCRFTRKTVGKRSSFFQVTYLGVLGAIHTENKEPKRECFE